MKNKNNIGLGTAAIGRPLYINVKQDAASDVFSLATFKENGLQLLEEAYLKGVRYFDTSPGYGMAEELLLEWLATKNDSTIHVATKWGYTYVAAFNPTATLHEVKEHSLLKLNQQWEVSKKLAPYLKVYQIHSATLDTGVLDNKAILERLHVLKKQHDIIIGFTTTGANQAEVLEKGLSIKIDGETLFQSVQCTFNILDQSILKHSKVLNQLTGPLIIKEALANGRLIPNTPYDAYQPLYKFLEQLATTYNVTADAIALRYCIDVFPSAIVLSGANNTNHLTSNLKATTFELTPLEIEQLNRFVISTNHYWQERKQLSWN